MGAIERGFRNPFRNKVRAGVVVFLLALIIGLFAVMVQAAFHTQKQLEGLRRACARLSRCTRVGEHSRPLSVIKFSLA